MVNMQRNVADLPYFSMDRLSRLPSFVTSAAEDGSNPLAVNWLVYARTSGFRSRRQTRRQIKAVFA